MSKLFLKVPCYSYELQWICYCNLTIFNTLILVQRVVMLTFFTSKLHLLVGFIPIFVPIQLLNINDE